MARPEKLSILALTLTLALAACQLAESGLAADADVIDVVDAVTVDAIATDSGLDDSFADVVVDDADVQDAPVDVPVSILGLEAWYRSDLGVTQNGRVSAWVDSSGSGDSARNLAQSTLAAQPSFLSSDPNFAGHPSLSTTAGTNAWLATEFWSKPLTQPFTVFAVARATNAASAWLFDNSTGATNSEVGVSVHGSGKMRLFAGAYGADVVASANVTYALVAIFDSVASNSRLYVSQNTPQAGADIGTNAPSPLLVGDAVNDSAGSFAGWTIAELAFYARALSTADVATLNAYASTRYALTIAP